MKKQLLCILSIIMLWLNVNAQCTTAVQSVIEDFNTGVWPACWTGYGLAGISTNKIQIRSYYKSQASTFVFPKTVNAKGIITFIAQNTTNGQQGYGDITVGAVSDPSNMSSFVAITTVNIYPTTSGNQIVYAPYTVDLSSYTGNYQYIVFTMPGGSNYSKTINIDDINYESSCISTVVNAIAQDLTVQLDNTGNATISPNQVDNGSSSDCGDHTLSLDVSSFSCSDIGANTVTLTATGNQGNTATATATITVEAPYNDEALSATENKVCKGSSTTINTASSVHGINYLLRDNNTDSIVDGPIVGTGGSLSFNSGNISAATTYNVLAETTAPSYALSFDGVDDYISTSIPTNFHYNTAYTIETWVKSPLPGVNGGQHPIFFAGTAAVSDVEVYVQSSTNDLVVVHNRGNGGTLSYHSFPDPPNNTWYHLAVVFNGTTIEAFYNGVSQGKVAIANPLVSANSALSIGYVNSSVFNVTLRNFLGEMDDYRLWSTAKTSSEINDLMNSCLSGNETGLETYYSFYTGSGAVAIDLSSNNNDGALLNTNASNWVAGYLTCDMNAPACTMEMTQTITIGINPDYNQTETATICAGESYTFPDGSVQQNITSPVVYTSNLQTLTGCDSIIETTLNITTVDTSTSLNGNTITSNQVGATYRWLNCDNGNAAISNETSQSFSPIGSGNYAAEVTKNSCVDTSFCRNMIITGINELHNIVATIAPNPVKNVLTINAPTTIKQVSIYNLNGLLIKAINNNFRDINVSELSKGMYILVLQSENGISQTKFIKE